jgi:predicted Zn finger-like uncharacterized protein
MSEMSEDSLEPLVTQCPNCDTRFRVTENQLQVAAGRVRCGACLAVFEGTAHLSLDGETLAVGDDPDVDALLEELDELTEGEPTQPPSLPSIGKGDLVPLSQSELVAPADSDSGLPDELLALEAELLAEMSVVSVGQQKNTTTGDARDILQEIPAIDSPQTETVNEADEAQESGLEVAIAEPFGIEVPEALDELAETEVGDSDETGEVDGDQTAAAGEDVELADTNVVDDIADDGNWLDEVAEDVWQSSDSNDREEGRDKDEDIGKDTEKEKDEVIELVALTQAPAPSASLYQAEEAVRPRRSLLTILLILLALIGLPVQVLWFQYDVWVRDLAYRPIYETICEMADCVLPPMQDVSKIVSKKSFIRAHPERDEARIVDVLMVNNAEFSQPYPLIELVATNMQGQLVAGRRFKPAEYLQGDAQVGDMFAPRTPVHVSLEIQDPAGQALNFEIHFR